MQYRTLGRTGIRVSPYALSAMMFGAIGNPDHDNAIHIIHKALDAGIDFVDTAAYSRDESEEIVGKALKGRRDDVVLAAKAGLPMGIDEIVPPGTNVGLPDQCAYLTPALQHPDFRRRPAGERAAA